MVGTGEYTRVGSIQWWAVYQGGEYIYLGREYTMGGNILGWRLYRGGEYTMVGGIPGRRVYQGGEYTMFKEHITTFVKVVNCVRKRQEKPQNFVIRNQIQLWTI